MEKVRSLCGQPSDRGRLKNRADSYSVCLNAVLMTFMAMLIFYIDC